MEESQVLAKGLAERIGMSGSVLTYQTPSQPGAANSPNQGQPVKHTLTPDMPDHITAVKLIIESLCDPARGAVTSLDEIDAIGHRVVHGGEKITTSVLIDNSIKDIIRDCIELGPLHNPPNLAGIEACEENMPGKPQVAVFDTSFHQSMPREAYLYGLPYEYYEQYKVRRYGFHGTSHRYISRRAAQMLGKNIKNLKIITCHLGNGSSIAAVKFGKSIETSMGFTPLEGLMMGTRSGDIDPAIVSYIMEKENWTSQEVNDFLNKKCGVLGLSGVSSDFRDVQEAAEKGNFRAQLALDVFAHDVKKYIGAYAALMDGVDAIVFSAGLGENSPSTRWHVCDTLGYLGIAVDPEKNMYPGSGETDISRWGAKCRTLVIPTDEELMIAMDTMEIMEGRGAGEGRSGGEVRNSGGSQGTQGSARARSAVMMPFR